MHGIGAGQNQPIVAVELAQRCIERFEVGRGANLQHRNLDRLRTQRAQAFAELAGLMRGAGHKNPTTRSGSALTARLRQQQAVVRLRHQSTLCYLSAQRNGVCTGMRGAMMDAHGFARLRSCDDGKDLVPELRTSRKAARQ